MRGAVRNTVLTVLAATCFGVGVGATKGRQSAMEFFAGYLVEQSLSVDNLFVFILLFEYFKVPPALQGRALKWGILGAIAMRGVMIGVGVELVQRFRSVTLVFAGILLASAAKLLAEDGHDGPAPAPARAASSASRGASAAASTTSTATSSSRRSRMERRRRRPSSSASSASSSRISCSPSTRYPRSWP